MLITAVVLLIVADSRAFNNDSHWHANPPFILDILVNAQGLAAPSKGMYRVGRGEVTWDANELGAGKKRHDSIIVYT